MRLAAFHFHRLAPYGVLANLAETAAKLGDPLQAHTLLTRAAQETNGIDDKSVQARAEVALETLLGRVAGGSLPDARRDALSRAYKAALSKPITAGGERVFQSSVPGANGQPHVTIEGAGHFLQEDKGPEIAAIVADFIAASS